MLDAIFNLLGNFATLIINGIITFILQILNLILGPLDNLITSLFPNFGSLIQNVVNLFNFILAGPVSYFLSILNNFPYLKGAIRVSLFFDITLLSVIGVYYLIHGTIILVNKVKGMIH